MITYVDTSVLLTLLVEDEVGSEATERLWLDSDYLVCAEIGYVEARAALAAARRASRLTTRSFREAKTGLEELWTQVGTITINNGLVRSAGDLAESDKLRGYDAVHLAAALTTSATVFATSDDRLLLAARRHGLATSNPLRGSGVD